MNTRAPTVYQAQKMTRGWDDPNDYNLVGEIGKGAFATVYKVTSKFNGLPYAAKELEKRRFMKNGVIDQKVENEMRIMKSIEHVSRPDLPWSNRLISTADISNSQTSSSLSTT